MSALMMYRFFPPAIRNLAVSLCRREFSLTEVFYNDKTSDEDNGLLQNDTISSIIEEDLSENVSPSSPSGFAQAHKQHLNLLNRVENLEQTKHSQEESFETLLRKSQHVHIGSAKGKTVVGEIFHEVKNDLYIDFGGKFHCVCRRPEEDGDKYHRGVKVRLWLHDFELTDHFIGAARDITLLEASADLIGLLSKQVK